MAKKRERTPEEKENLRHQMMERIKSGKIWHEEHRKNQSAAVKKALTGKSQTKAHLKKRTDALVKTHAKRRYLQLIDQALEEGKPISTEKGTITERDPKTFMSDLQAMREYVEKNGATDKVITVNNTTLTDLWVPVRKYE